MLTMNINIAAVDNDHQGSFDLGSMCNRNKSMISRVSIFHRALTAYAVPRARDIPLTLGECCKRISTTSIEADSTAL